MADLAEIASCVARLGVLVDHREWDALKQLFTPLVRVDYTSLFGGSAEEKSRETLVDGWAAFLPRFHGTQHLIGASAVTLHGETARARAPVTALHFHAPALTGAAACWRVGGHYDIGLRRGAGGWRIERITLEALWQEGAPPA